MAPHQALDVAAADVLARQPQRFPHSSGSVGEVVLGMQLADPAEQPLIIDRPGGPLAGGALVVGGRRHVQDPADRLDAEAAAVRIDVAAHLVRSSSSSFAKNTEADFKISFARLSSKFSARSRRISSRSWLLGRSGRLPESASCWRTFLRNVSGCIPRSAAICAIGRSLSNASRMPRWINSSGYFFGRGMRTGGSPSARTSSWLQGLRQTRDGSPGLIVTPFVVGLLG